MAMGNKLSTLSFRSFRSLPAPPGHQASARRPQTTLTIPRFDTIQSGHNAHRRTSQQQGAMAERSEPRQTWRIYPPLATIRIRKTVRPSWARGIGDTRSLRGQRILPQTSPHVYNRLVQSRLGRCDALRPSARTTRVISQRAPSRRARRNARCRRLPDSGLFSVVYPLDLTERPRLSYRKAARVSAAGG